MSSPFRKTLTFALLAAAAAATWLLRPTPESGEIITTTAGVERGYYMNDAVFSGLDEDGRIIYRMAATRIEGSERTNELDFSDVEIRYAQDLDVPWTIRARSARTFTDRDFLELTDVLIESTSEDPRETARIEASDIQLQPERQIASTQGPVRFAIGESTIDAVGLTADLRDERIMLEADVNARISP